MSFNSSFKTNIIFLLLLSITFCQRLAKDYIGGWGEKPISINSDIYRRILDTTEKYIISEGYSLEETDILPIGLFKQTLNGINYRIICAVKKKSKEEPTIFDILMHESNNEIKMISSKNPENSSTDLSDKAKKSMKNAIIKYYFKNLYEIKELNIEYEYHNIDGLYNYAIYDVSVELGNKNENIKKRVLIIYRNDRTFTVEEELKAE